MFFKENRRKFLCYLENPGVLYFNWTEIVKFLILMAMKQCGDYFNQNNLVLKIKLTTHHKKILTVKLDKPDFFLIPKRFLFEFIFDDFEQRKFAQVS